MPDKFDQPALLLTYGDSGRGKSTDMCYSFPRGLFVGPPGAFTPALSVIGYRPRQITSARTLEDILTILEAEAEKVSKTGKHEYDALVVDDLTLYADAYASVLEQRGYDKYKFWGQMRKTLLRLREAMCFAGMHVAMNAHERGPHQDERKGFVPGGPSLPGTMPADMPKAFSAVLRVLPVTMEEGGIASALGWPYVYGVDETDSQYITKNRYGVYGRLPMNVGELLRLFYALDGNFPVRRHPALDWQEEVVEKIAARLASVDPASAEHQQLRQGFVDAIRAKYKASTKVAIWTLRDGVHRAILRRLKVQAETRLFGVV